jgi:high affinity Mn2+ porin
VKLLKIGIMLTALFSFSKEVKAQGDDNRNHYKGLIENRFDSLENWSLHFQLTDVWQSHPAFHAKYSGSNSLQDTAERAMSVTSTLFLGRKLWKGASVFVNAEIAGGKGLSYATGLGGESNGDCFRVGNPAPALYMARGYFEQYITIRKSRAEHRDGDLNQLADNIPSSCVKITVGKFSLADFFDDNSYSHDPRSEFMNWALMDNGAWDYAANTRGYTWGGVIELIEPGYSIRASSVLVGKLTNSQIMDLNIKKANGNNLEFEKKFKIKNHPGNLHFLGYVNFSHAPFYNTAINEMKNGDSSLVNVIRGHAAGVQYGGVKYGLGISFNQELTKNIGVFSRIGWNDGQTASWAFAEIDQTANAGMRIRGDVIKRPNDNFGIACIVNGISAPHRNYLNSGGYGFILGDGKLNYGYEQILEIFYKVKLSHWLWVTADYQFTINPGYNKDRGPVNIFGIRTHIEL